MKTIVIFGVSAVLPMLASCTQSGPQPPTVTTGRPYGAYAYSSDYIGPSDSSFRSWTTAQLQKRREELYYMVPQTQTRHGVPAYIYHGGQLPAQDEIRAVEGELNRRYSLGDKAAILKPVWPEVRRHI